jgi:DNA modification methylase
MSQRQRDERIHKIANDNLSPKQLDAFLHAHLQACSPFVKSGAAVYWCHDIRFTQQFRDLLVAHNFHISDTLIWKKNGSSNHMANYAKFYEPILYGWKSGSEHQWHGTWSPNVIELDRLEDLSQEQLIEIIKNIPSNVQYFDREPKATGRLHPTVKPTKLVAYHIMNSSRIGDIVFDGFAGSGAALLAAEKTGRRARCVEFEPKFCDVIIQRWQELTGLQATRESDGVKWDDITTEAAIYTPQLSNVFSNLSTVFDIERVSNVQLTL